MPETAQSAPTIQVKLPDGSAKEVPKGTTPLDIAREISPRLADAAIVARSNGTLIDLKRPLEKDTELRILTPKDPEALQVFRHSSAHLMAAAVLELFPETKLGHGPATENGFFYDFYRPTPFTPEDLEKIEKKMQELVEKDIPYAQDFLPRQDGLERFKSEGDFMKCHFIEQFTAPDEKISLYRTGKFVDFCRGPHIPSTGKIKAFKLLNIAGAYWLGDEKNPQLQRIYGTSFYSKKELDDYLHQLEEAKRRDHRLLGKQLDLFSIQELAGPGLIFWHPKGGIMRKTMEDWLRDEYLKRGYSLVFTPHVARVDLWKISGHEGYYAENMFTPMKLDDADYRIKPMNCPFHILIYKDQLRSYRDLPVRLGELGTVYRYERSGVMHGLMRVRGFTQDDAHIFCTPQQIEDEIVGCIDFAFAVLSTFGFKEYQVELSTWDPKDRKNFVGSDEQWELASRSLENALKARNIPYKSYSRRSGVLWAEDRREAGGRDRAPVAALHHPVRLQPAAALRPGVRGRRRAAPPAVDGPSRALGIGGALLRRAHRALRGRVPAVALAGAGGGGADQRKAPRVRGEGRGAIARGRRARPRGQPQREDERQDPRTRAAEGALHRGGGGQGSAGRLGQRPHPRQREDRRHAGGGVRGQGLPAHRGEGDQPIATDLQESLSISVFLIR